jgi:hypothetical protein
MKTCNKISYALALCMAPVMASAEVTFGGEVTLGFGDTHATGTVDGFAHVDLQAAGEHTASGDLTIGFDLNADLSYNAVGDGEMDLRLDTLEGATVYLDFGDGGRLSYATGSRCGAGRSPWIDGDIIGDNIHPQGGGDSVHTRIGGKFRCVGATPAVRDLSIQPAPFVARTEGYLLYENSAQELDYWAVYDPTRRLYGSNPESGSYDATAALPGMAEWEVGATYNFGPVVGSLAYNDLDDVDVRMIFPMRDIGLTTVLRYEDRLSEPGNSHRFTISANWRARDMGAFKGIRAIYQTDDSVEGDGFVVQANFGASDWSASVALDKDGDYAMEGSYDINETLAIEFGYSSGCSAGDCFNGNAGMVNAAAQSSSWAVGLTAEF